MNKTTLNSRYRLLSAESRANKRETRLLQRKVQRQKNHGRNSWMFDHVVCTEVQRQGTFIKRECRYINLLVGFLKGVSYKAVENSVKEGNEPSATSFSLYSKLHGIDLSTQEINRWLKAS